MQVFQEFHEFDLFNSERPSWPLELFWMPFSGSLTWQQTLEVSYLLTSLGEKRIIFLLSGVNGLYIRTYISYHLLSF